MDNPLVNIDGDSIERLTTEMYKTMTKSIRTFADIPAVQSVAIEIRNQIDEFKPLIPLILAVKNPGMRERHWNKFREITGIDLVWSNTLTFNECLSLGIEEFGEDITKISETAGKEYQIEQTLDKMEAEWENNLLELTPHKKTGLVLTFLLILNFNYIRPQEHL